MTKLKISEILKNQTITNQFDFSGSCPDKDGCTVTYTIFPTSLFINEIKYKYFNRVMFVDDPDTAFAELVAQFTTWKNARGFMYARMMYAYSLGYNPIENYSSIEHTESESSLKHGLQSQRTYNSDKVTTGHTNDKVVRTYQQEKATDKSGRYGVNSSTLVDVTENTNEMTGGHTDEYSGTKYDEHTGGFTDSNSGKDITGVIADVTKSGNIGVMTASQMLQSQYDGLIQEVQYRAIKDYLDNNSFYSEGVCLYDD